MTKEQFVQMVENVLSQLGVDPEKSRIKDQKNAWLYQKGSALIRIELFEVEGKDYVLISSPVMDIPLMNREAFFAELLTINGTLINAALMIYHGTVLIKSDREIEGLDEKEFKRMLERTSQYADALDNYLIEKYAPEQLSKIGEQEDHAAV